MKNFTNHSIVLQTQNGQATKKAHLKNLIKPFPKKQSHPRLNLFAQSILLFLFIMINPLFLPAQTFNEIIKAVDSNPNINANFGYSVSISGDYAIVGAYGAGNGGSAYIYKRDWGGGDNWGEVKKIPGNKNNFGWSVSISGDYAIVGASSDDAGGTSAGAAYIFKKDWGGVDNWGQVKKIQASDKQGVDHFGWSVSISGDYAIVGAPLEDPEFLYNAGAAYIFKRDEGGFDNWGEVTKILASDGQPFDHFGSSVSISGGYAIVGTAWEDSGGIEAGAAYIFKRDEGGVDNWGELKKIQASDIAAGDGFGYSVSISGDYALAGRLEMVLVQPIYSKEMREELTTGVR